MIILTSRLRFKLSTLLITPLLGLEIVSILTCNQDFISVSFRLSS